MATHERKLGGHDNGGDKLGLRALTLAQTVMRVGQEEGVGYSGAVGKANRAVVLRWCLLTLLTPLYIPGCHPQYGAGSVGINTCKCSSKINMKSTSAQIIPM
jgi:hypothetical protein